MLPSIYERIRRGLFRVLLGADTAERGGGHGIEMPGIARDHVGNGALGARGKRRGGLFVCQGFHLVFFLTGLLYSTAKRAEILKKLSAGIVPLDSKSVSGGISMPKGVIHTGI